MNAFYLNRPWNQNIHNYSQQYFIASFAIFVVSTDDNLQVATSKSDTILFMKTGLVFA